MGWRIKLADTVADLASNGAVAISSRIVPLAGLDTRLIGMVLTRNGELADTGGTDRSGSACDKNFHIFLFSQNLGPTAGGWLAATPRPGTPR